MSEQYKHKSAFKGEGMFRGASHLVFELAKDLRRNMTDAEKLLWSHLKVGVHGVKVRRQHPIGIYIADFYLHKLKLIIEVDGKIHDLKDVKENDRIREDFLKEQGCVIVRFTNERVFKELDVVLDEINSTVEKLLNSSKELPKQ
jgi:imidazole glycerol-phosphate synthase subunit HisF